MSTCFVARNAFQRASAVRRSNMPTACPPVPHRGIALAGPYRSFQRVIRKAVEVGDDNTSGAKAAQKSGPPAVSIDSLKASLYEALYGTERGLQANSEVQARINELINQLEVKGGQGADISSVDFGGAWELLYTNAVDLIALLSVSKLPLPIKIGAITQTINTSNGTVENSVQLEVPLLQTSVSTVSSYNVASPKRLQFTVQRGILHTPAIEGNLELPASINIMGQNLDLAPLRDALAPLTRSAVSFAESTLGRAPDLEVPLQTQTWQLTTYLDATLRITRGDGGAVYVFKKVVAPAATQPHHEPATQPPPPAKAA